MTESHTILLCGVGGQGTITAADLLARAATSAGFDVKVSEIHGMSQRGGAVTTVVRYGEDVHTMVADEGACDCIVSFESMEALRNINFLAPDGYLLVSDVSIKPMSVSTGTARMPEDLDARLEEAGAVMIESEKLAQLAGNVKTENVVLLGALESQLGFGRDIWRTVIENKVPPKTIDANLRAFDLGYEFATGHASGN